MSQGNTPLSPPLAIGVGLLCFAFSFALSSVWPAWEMRGALSAQLAALAQARESRPVTPSPDESEPQALAEEIPKTEKLPPGGKLQKLQQLIVGQGLSPDSIVYRQEANVDSGAMQYHVSVPLKTSYPVLRKLLEAVQTELPGVRLDKLSLQRTRASESMVDAQLEFVLRLEGGEQ